MLLYVVMTIFQLAGAADTEPPLEIFRGNALFTEQRCEVIAKETTIAANTLIRKRHLRLIAVSYCKHAGVSI